MTISSFLRRFGRRRHKRSFYDSQEVMRRAVETTGPVDMCLCTDTELHSVLETDKSALRRQAAGREIARRAGRRHTPELASLH
ncbi:MAG: hypothetical protein CVT73_13615 [Alphaproteobacteria bacterium HGW-Alphaproteobacteria-12]|nr:MAG: hypothetical protein CVT73_13615 [Alphaproteobacteria bacterium HGW-Alphaproteobacteria-12]